VIAGHRTAASGRGIRTILVIAGIVGMLAVGSVGATVASPGGSVLADTTGGDAVVADDALLSAQEAGEQQGNVTRDGGNVVLAVTVERIGEAGPGTNVSVEVPSVGGATTASAVREGDRYVARVPITDVVPPEATADLSSTTVTASHDGETVITGAADLRYVARTAPATFQNATLAVPVDVRGLGGAAPVLLAASNGERFQTTVEGSGSNATLLVTPTELSGVPAQYSMSASVVMNNATVSPGPVAFSIADAAERTTALEYRNGGLVVVQPLAHPELGPNQIEVALETNGPTAVYSVRDSGPEPFVAVPENVVGAGSVQVRVYNVSAPGGDGSSEEGGTAAETTALVDVAVTGPGRATVPLRIAKGSLYAPEPAALTGYDALLIRDDSTTYLPIDPALLTGSAQSLPSAIAQPSQDATAILIGGEGRPARVDLTVVPPPPEPEPEPEPADQEGDEFVGLWMDIGSIVSLLFVAMIGSVLSVGSVYGLRLLSPARSAIAGPRAVVGHFCFGGIGGIVCIAVVQWLYWGPVLGTATVGGTEIGLGALLVGTFHGGLTATGLRLGLGTVGAWPTRRVIDETSVPVRIRFTDDEGEEVPGKQIVAIRRAEDGSLVETTTLAGTTTEVALTPGEYSIKGEAAERTTDDVELAIDDPSPRPETRSVHLTVGRPGLQVEVTDAQTEDAIPSGQVTVTTDQEETKSATIDDSSVTTSLPVTTGTVTAVVSAPGYDDETVEIRIDEALTTVDVALAPSSGTLVVSALVAADPIADATVEIEPAESPSDSSSGSAVDSEAAEAAPAGPAAVGGDSDEATTDPPEIGVRTASGVTDEAGRLILELPAGSYRATLVLDGPNADMFAIKDGTATISPDEESAVEVYARFDWEPDERVRRRANGLRSTIRSVAEEATADPTIPLYFAGVTEALLDCVAALPDAGHHFATSAHDPDEVATAAVAAAEAALEAVGQAMQAEGVRSVLVSGPTEPVRVSPTLDATPADLLAYLEQDLTIASVDARAHEIDTTLDEQAERLSSVAPARAVVEKAVGLVPESDQSTHAAAREFAALLLLDAVEQCLADEDIRSRLDGSA